MFVYDEDMRRLLVVLLSISLLAFQRRATEADFPPAPDANKAVEFVFPRLRYDMDQSFGRGGFRRFQRWAADYPASDIHFLEGVKRLTRIDTRSRGIIVDLDSDAIYKWPWIYVENPGAWHLSETQAARLREYLLRGGFLMGEDMHGDYEWENFMVGMRMVLPDRPVEDLKDNDEIFHVVYDLGDRVQIPGTRYLWGGRQYTPDSAVAKWRAIRDEHGRIVVAICHNSDVGDAWEWADSPDYPERATTLAYRIAINYIIYAMTH